MSFSDIRQPFLDLISQRREQARQMRLAFLGQFVAVAPTFPQFFNARDPLALKQLYSTEKVGLDVAEAIKKGNDAGRTADLAASTTQGDVLSRARRAFVLRHASPLRLMCHAAGRAQGHGEDRGALHAPTNVVQVFVKVGKKA